MSTERRFKNVDWALPPSDRRPGAIASWDYVGIAVLMDIRDELQTLNRLLGCRNFVEIPVVLRAIKANTRKPVRATKKPSAKKAAR